MGGGHFHRSRVTDPPCKICSGAFLAGIQGIFGVEVERGRFQPLGEARQAVLRVIGAHRFPPPRIPDLYD